MPGPKMLRSIFDGRMRPPVLAAGAAAFLYMKRRQLVQAQALESAPATKADSFDFSMNMSFRLRPLERKDFDNYFLGLLAELTAVGKLPLNWCEQRLTMLTRDKQQEMVVIEDLANARVCAAGTLIVENKFIHECGCVGHLEDVVVHAGLRNKGLGKRIVERINEMAKARGCYKILVDCSQENIPFYEACGYKLKDAQMARYFDVNEEELPAAEPQKAAALAGTADLGVPAKVGADGTRRGGMFRFRPLRASDREKFLNLLSQLTTVGQLV